MDEKKALTRIHLPVPPSLTRPRRQRRGRGRPASFIVTRSPIFHFAWRRAEDWAKAAPEYVTLYEHLKDAADSGQTTWAEMMTAVHTKSRTRVERLLESMDRMLSWIQYESEEGVRRITVKTLDAYSEIRAVLLPVSKGYALNDIYGPDVDLLVAEWKHSSATIRGFDPIVTPEGYRALRMLMKGVGDEERILFYMGCYLTARVDFPDGAAYQLDVNQWLIHQRFPWRLQTFCTIADLLAFQIEAAAVLWVEETGNRLPHGLYVTDQKMRELMAQRHIQRIEKKQGKKLPRKAVADIRRRHGLVRHGDPVPLLDE